MTELKDTIRLRDIAKGLLRGIPDTLTVQRGLWNLITARPDHAGSIGLLLEKQAQRYPDHPALVFEDRSWTYAEFNAWANRCATVFRKHGVKAGDAVGILMENRPEVLACVAGAVKLGAVAGMLNHHQRGDVLSHSLLLTKARLLVVGDECMEALGSTPHAPGSKHPLKCLWDGDGQAPHGYLNLREETAKATASNRPETARIKMSEPCFYIFTSGTTGMPKASVMTHYRWVRGAAGLGQLALRLKSADVFYCCLPLYHNNALTVSWGAALGSGATLALSRKFSASRFWDEIRGYQATAFCYIGELCRYLLNRPATSKDRDHQIRLICGNGLRPEIWDEFVNRFGIEQVYEFYGASESNVAFINGFGLSKTAGFCPLPFAVVEFDTENETPVRNAKGFMNKVGTGGVGLLISEITDRAPFDGYTDKKASDAKLMHDVFKKGDCWFNTGDLVRNQGYRHIQFVDRVGDTFRWKGENVATTEVEAALNRFPGVEQACVYGVQVPNADGRVGMAALTVSKGSFDAAALARHLIAALPVYAVPAFIRLREEQEVTGTFKFRKVELKKEGFDPGKVSEPLFVLRDRDQGYEPMTGDLYMRIQSGKDRL